MNLVPVLSDGFASCRIAVLMTCFNRKEKTLASIEALYRNHLPSKVSLTTFLVNDGSTDGTELSVKKNFPNVRVIAGDGTLYWNGGMRAAFSAAMSEEFDFYIWLNDDTLLYPNAIGDLLACHREVRHDAEADVIVIGSVQDPTTMALTYGGVLRRRKWRPTHFTLIHPTDVPVKCETMNGNCVLIPRAVVEAVGNLERRFIHGMGDQDYGLRAVREGHSIWVMPGYAGTCSRNGIAGTFNDRSLSLRLRLKHLLGPKGLPAKPWLVFTKRHAGPLWPLCWVWPYLKIVLVK